MVFYIPLGTIKQNISHKEITKQINIFCYTSSKQYSLKEIMELKYILKKGARYGKSIT